jgi:hypothetical protein
MNLNIRNNINNIYFMQNHDMYLILQNEIKLTEEQIAGRILQ